VGSIRGGVTMSDELGALHLKYRPKTFDEFVGGDEVKESLQNILQREVKDMPHAFLFTGPSGSGKTTMARILSNRLGCSARDLFEFNTANMRGIDTIREIANSSRFVPIDGPVRVYLLDECFMAGTKITTDHGVKNIEDIMVGEKIINIQGVASVTHTFTNKVSLDRIVKVCLSNATEIVCSKEHLFFTNDGWKKAIELTQNDLLFCLKSDTALNTNSQMVESVEIYKQGYNDTAFACIISDKERNQNYVTFYDLEIDSHPSYYANGVLVHNCHRQTGDAAEALLKLLEEPRPHVFFMLCTTEPAKLLTTAKTRLTTYEFSPLSINQIYGLLKSIVKKEGKEADAKCLREIAKSCNGSAREAVKLLDQIIDIEDVNSALSVIHTASVGEVRIADICRLLLEPRSEYKWKTMGAMLNNVTTEYESFRHGIANYLAAVLVSRGNDRIADILLEFESTWIYSQKARMILACYRASKL